jgi:THO complex subunit 1
MGSCNVYRSIKDVVQHSKGLVLLRICNELSRRAPKSTHSVLRGRISIFLTLVFPLTDRSGVNLRGDYNRENVTYFESSDAEEEDSAGAATVEKEKKKEEEGEDSKMEVDETLESKPAAEEPSKASQEVGDKMDVDSGKQPAEPEPSKPPKEPPAPKEPREPSFYTIFWTLQHLFSNPPLLFDPSPASFLPPSLPDAPTNLSFLRFGIKRTLDRFNEMSKRERELAGASKGKKPKVDVAADEDIDGVKKRYFFPKFLTSRNLLDQEVSTRVMGPDTS